MATTTQISVEEYLSTSYRPDCDYVDGEVIERNMGEHEHAKLQSEIIIWLGNHRKEWNILPVVEQRVQVLPMRFRVPDVCILDGKQKFGSIIRTPPMVCIEVLSKSDSLQSLRDRVHDYLEMGVPVVWIFDPAARVAFVWTKQGMVEQTAGELRVENSAVRIPLDEIFTSLD